MDDFPSIDELTKRLTELGAITPEQWDEFKRLELTALASERKEDALMLFGRLPHDDPAKQAMEAGLLDLRQWGHERVMMLPIQKKPKLTFVSGAPGSGKSTLMEKIAKDHPETLLATSDDFKYRFKERLPEWIANTPEPARSQLGRSVYIHRLTSLPNWEMVDEAIETKRSLAIELLGTGAAEDARTIKRAIAKGYEVEVYHVGCSIEASLARAAKRHFQQKERGEEGRWIGLSTAAGRQRIIVSYFAALKELLLGTDVKMALIDNTDFQMKTIWTHEDTTPPPIDRFATWKTDPALWREGVNPAADLCGLCKDEKGAWHVALVERASDPFKGKESFPGGFIKGVHAEGLFEWGREDAKSAALRRFTEETLCLEEPLRVLPVGKFDDLERDPRNNPGRWVESWVFAAEFKQCSPLSGGDSARSAKWVPVDEVLVFPERLAFDHAELLVQALRRLDPEWQNKSKQDLGAEGGFQEREGPIHKHPRAKP